MNKANKTNRQLVDSMMNISKQGVLKQVFILEAIYKYSQLVLEDKSKWEEGSIISQDAWRHCAQECLEAISTERANI